jgi:hypothetical protein
VSTRPDADELRDEYDFTPEELRQGERGRFAARYARRTDVAPPDPEPADVPAEGSTTR